jgi:transposase
MAGRPADRRGFAVSGTGLGAHGDRLEVAVAGRRVPLRVVWSRPLPSTPSSVTVYRDTAGFWWASFVCRIHVPEEPVAATGRATGLDVGLTMFAAVEDADHDVANPRSATTAAKEKKRADGHLARKTPGSNNRLKARRRKARIETKVADQRADFAHKQARHLVAVYDRMTDWTPGVVSQAEDRRHRKGQQNHVIVTTMVT